MRLQQFLQCMRKTRLLSHYFLRAAFLFSGFVVALGPTSRTLATESHPTPVSIERGTIYDRSGLVMARTELNEGQNVRRYPYGSTAAHVIGYWNQNSADLSVPRGSGLEETMKQDLEVDERGFMSNLHLTIDMRFQRAIEAALLSFKSSALYENGMERRGAAVLMDVQNGNVLAMVSLPTFDPNEISSSATAYSSYKKNIASPLINRAILSYAPGVTFLPVTCLAGGMAGLHDKPYQCDGLVQYGNKSMKCWISVKGETHGVMHMQQALASSCACYFFQLANASGVDQMVKAGRAVGLGQGTGIELADDGGILPGPEWLAANRPNERWSDGYTANTAIGQGMVLATPLQLTVLYAAVANGGTVWKPRLIYKTNRHNTGQEETLEKPPEHRAVLTDLGVAKDHLKTIQLGLEDVVQKTTARQAVSEKISIAGRTGTAQNWLPNGRKDNHVWFCGYAPTDKPRWALTVMVQGGHAGGTIAAPIAKEIFEQVAAIESGELEVDMTPLSK